MIFAERTRKLVFLSTVCVLSFGTILQGATVFLKNGDRLSGKLTAIEDRQLTIRPSYAAQPVKIKISNVKNIDAESEYRVYMANGDRISGRIQSMRDGFVSLNTASYKGELRIPVSDIQKLEQTDESAMSSSASQTEADESGAEQDEAAPAPDEPAAGEKGNEAENLWHGSVSLSGNRQSGNTDRTSASAEIQARRKTEADVLSLLFRYNYAEEDGALTARDVYGQMGYEYNLSRRLYWLLSASLLADEFRDLDLRTTTGLSLGYRWLTSDTLSLSTEAGLTYISRNYETNPDETSLSARLAARLEAQLTETLQMFEDLTVYPNLQGDGHVLHNEVGLRSQITKAWHLKISHVTDYDSDPPGQLEDTDTTLSLGLGYSF